MDPGVLPNSKLICHHTAGENHDPNPVATIRAIYYYHAVTQSWGDIGYNAIVDEAGLIYEGRFSQVYPVGVTPTFESSDGRGVTGAHSYQYNSGTFGIAMLGTLTAQDATAAARGALTKMLAWEADRHAINPNGADMYTNPVTYVTTTFANLAGHRDVGSTECPGGVFYNTLPSLRNAVVATIAASPTPTPSASPTATPSPPPSPTPTPTPVPTPCDGNCP